MPVPTDRDKKATFSRSGRVVQRDICTTERKKMCFQPRFYLLAETIRE